MDPSSHVGRALLKGKVMRQIITLPAITLPALALGFAARTVQTSTQAEALGSKK